ncbi:MAG TPA: 16S rRNA (cytidine(1402)-2'-O)-methyltransferase [Anaerolineales bacterium]|nr:16S rRNA (cytidine(1402)-2'-O)-methyltransferase [Anaerolineales bacterium]
MSTLYLVATPIGNLEDLSPRAKRILQEASLIAAEDTRHTGKLLKHFDIQTPLTSYFDHNKGRKLAPILAKLVEDDVALVSDAGMPGINDPGYELVRAALAAGHTVSPVPGPSAPIAALAASGLPSDRFLYLGYLPRKSGERRKMLAEVAALPYTLIFLESPHRLLASLADSLTELGDRQIAVARELTKMHEEIFRGQISEAAAHFDGTRPQGEITLVVDGAPPEAHLWSLEQVRASLKAGLARGESVSAFSREIAAQSGWKRREIYRLATEIYENL